MDYLKNPLVRRFGFSCHSLPLKAIRQHLLVVVVVPRTGRMPGARAIGWRRRDSGRGTAGARARARGQGWGLGSIG